MTLSEQSNAYGFAGLTSLVSDFKQPPLVTETKSSNVSPAADATSRPLLRKSLRHQAGTTLWADASAAVEHPIEWKTVSVQTVIQGRDYGRGPIVLVVIAAVLGLIVYANLNSGSSDDKPVTANSRSSGTPRVAGPVNVAPNGVDPADTAFVQTMPVQGTNNVLGLNELNYCLAQDSRIATVQPLVDTYSHTAVAAYNAVVADFNSRCGKYRYREADMAQATAVVKAHQAEIDNDAQQLLVSWQGLNRAKRHSNGEASTSARDSN